MNTKNIIRVLALTLIFALTLCACGSKTEAPAAPVETTAAPAVSADLALSDWTLSSTIWSSANGASIDLTAVPTTYVEGMTATFVVRLEGEEVWNQPCEWNGTAFTSYADLNAEDGYCYYVMLTDATHTVSVDINTPSVPTDEALINLAASLESHCNATISDATYEGGVLSINEGSVSIQVPRINDGSDAVTCTSAELILNLDDGALAKTSLDLPAEKNADGIYTMDLANVSFQVPEMEGDHQLALSLVAQLSDGQTLEDPNCAVWFYSDGTVHLSVG